MGKQKSRAVWGIAGVAIALGLAACLLNGIPFMQHASADSAGAPAETDDPVIKSAQIEMVDSVKNFELKRNSKGQTYGISEFDPDLVAVVSDQGNDGYVYRSEMDHDEIQTPEQAVEYTRNFKPEVLNVYESDGETIIGTFTIS